MKITIIGAGNSALAMAAHLAMAGHQIVMWNRSSQRISKLLRTKTIKYEGVISGKVKLHLITTDLEEALRDTELVLITTPATSHQDLAIKIAKVLKSKLIIILNPGRTFGALEFKHYFELNNKTIAPTILESQTIIHTCRKISDDTVDIYSFKSDVLLSTFDANLNQHIIDNLPLTLQQYFIAAESMVETSIGNVGMILHCAPLLLNAGWTECEKVNYRYYSEGITYSIINLLEKIDQERIQVSRALGCEVESTKQWLRRTYHLAGENLFECLQNNHAYHEIIAPDSLKHRYILEDVPCGLVPLESAGNLLGLDMKNTSLIIDLATTLLDIDFRAKGRNIQHFFLENKNQDIRNFFNRREDLWSQEITKL